MLSIDILLRTSDGHPVYDSSGIIINKSSFGIHIGNHVLLCQNVKVLKDTVIPDGCICGFGALLNKIYTEANSILAGVPARVIRRDISWRRKDISFKLPSVATEKSRVNKSIRFSKTSVA